MPSTKPGFRRLLMAKVPFSLCSGSGRSLALLPGLGTEQKGVLLDEVVHIADVLPWGMLLAAVYWLGLFTGLYI